MGIASALGQPSENVRPRAHIHLRLAPIHDGDLLPLVDEGDPLGRDALPLGKLPHQIPQQRGLAASRWGQQQGTDELPVPEQPRGHGPRDALLLPGNADHSGGDLFQIGNLPVLHHSGAAKSHPEATPHRKKPLP